MAIDQETVSHHALISVREEQANSMLSNGYGAFDVRTGEFVITNVLTPRPWVNVMSNDRYGLVLSQVGGGFSWVGNSQLHRISRWEQDLAADAYGRWIYVFDKDSDVIHSTTFAPVRSHAEQEEVRHGLGNTVFRRRFGDLETTHTVFVPLEGAREHSIIEVRNLSDRIKPLRLGSYLELQLGGQGEWHREFHRLFVSLEQSGSTLHAWKRQGLEEGTRQIANSKDEVFVIVTGLDEVRWFMDKAQWLGREGRFDRPQALCEANQPQNTGRWDDPVAAFVSDVAIAPGETLRFALTIGSEVKDSKLDEIEAEFERTRAHHRNRAGALQIESSDPAFDLMNNAWLPHQAEVGRMKARCAYFQQGGAYGFRDQLQDSLCLLETDPAATLSQLERHAEAMYEDGGVRHWWHPETQIFIESRHSDTCLWLAFGVLEYLEETGDFPALQRPLRYLSRETQRFAGEGTLLDHCQRGIQRFLDRRSPRGLPLIGAGDWNDGLSHAGLDGKGESVWLAMFGFDILRRMAEVLDASGAGRQAAGYREEAESLRQAVEEYGWDGEWYIAGTSDDGRPFGSSECEHGKIFLNPQTWAVITGIASPDRAKIALESVRKHLLKPYGALLLSPAYQEVDPYIGYITRYAPGLRENGGVYSHASTWAVQAFAQAGDIETAYEIYRGMLPPLRSASDADAYQAEPYVMPGNVDGPDSPYEGRAGWTWYTGSAAWMRRVALRWLLGVRAGKDGLIVEPNLPEGLGPVKLVRRFRGEIYEIELSANLPGGKRVSSTVPLRGQSLPNSP